MEPTVTMSLSEYNDLRDTNKELQNKVIEYAEQIQKEQLSNIAVREWKINQMVTGRNKGEWTIHNVRRAILKNDYGIANEEIDAYLAKVNS